MYNKVQENSRVPQLEKETEEAQLKWVDLAKEHLSLAARGRMCQARGECDCTAENSI